MPLLLLALGLLLIYGAVFVTKTVENDLWYTSNLDYGLWWPFMSSSLVAGVDEFVGEVAAAGGYAYLSDDDGALGRHDGEASTSQHNLDLYGEVRAADLVVTGISLEKAYTIARRLNVFSGIGVYTDWASGGGIHLDVRTDRTPDNPAKWSRVAGVYGAIETAFV